MSAVPMCKMCGEYEIAMFLGGTMEYCSGRCADEAYKVISNAWHLRCEALMAHFDDDSSPYAGTYSEE